jgi:hypothetical protein
MIDENDVCPSYPQEHIHPGERALGNVQVEIAGKDGELLGPSWILL